MASVLPEGVLALEPGDPRHVGPFRPAGRLGSGGMGVVYAAVDDRGRPAAVKRVHRVFASDAEFRARFAREVDLVGRVRAACVPRFLGADTKADVPWLATEYVPGPTLAGYVREQGPLTGAALTAFALGVAEALAAIHAQGVVHRDLKPGNVILGPDGPRVLDFGIARAVEETALTTTGGLVGTPGWIAPEQYRGADATDRSDVFVWAGLVAFAATGRGAFGVGTSDVLASRVISEPPSLEGVPEDLRGVLERALAKEPEGRPSAEELRDQLAAALAPGGAARGGVPGVLEAVWPGVAAIRDTHREWAALAAPRKPWAVRRRRPLAAVGGVLSLALVAGTGAAVLLRGEESQGGSGGTGGEGGTGQVVDGAAADGVPEEYAELYETGEVGVAPAGADDGLAVVRTIAPATGVAGEEDLDQLRLTFLDAQETGSEANAMELTVRAEYLPDFGTLRLHSSDFAFVTVPGSPQTADLQRPNSAGVLATLGPQEPVAEFEVTFFEPDRNAAENSSVTRGVAFYLPQEAVPDDGPPVPEGFGGVCSESSGEGVGRQRPQFRLSAYDPVAAGGVPVAGCDFTITGQ
ncbi:serine/threonine-protein kinase [Nocardiopsis aegyptia]|uniref:Protein kinase domain-containing protein n=1 Tax=Nocardiopsis aegyptia TaxID=220378 RepID=A0A7Z0ES33_9ACTN|nr:serine/threonine-protein kinase [Nocardiopsis aegyptia]NYJ36310.1 hypothetical protein [Nocardiopsis aegyptia]